MTDKAYDFEGWPRSRRLNIPYKTGRIGFSVAEGVTDEQALAEVERALHSIAEGRTRAIVNIDGDHSPREVVLVIVSYIKFACIRAWRLTFGRSSVLREKAAISEALKSNQREIT